MFLPFEYTVLSSAKCTKLSLFYDLLRSEMKRRNKMGPRIEPCGASSLNNDSGDLNSLILTLYFRFVKHD